MYYYEVAPIKIVRASSFAFTYSSDQEFTVGTIVTIPVGKATQIGVVLRQVKKPSFETREITSTVIAQPLPTALIDTAAWVSEYYMTHLATVLSMMLPRGIGKKRRERSTPESAPVRKVHDHTPTREQADAITLLSESTSTTNLLFGTTGSGKTLVYKELARRTITSGKSVIILVPEIALTSQLVDEFRQDFPEQVILTHSRQTEAQRDLVWQQALQADTPHIAIGPRSALFLPLRSVGLIIIDEMHEPSYKQEQSPRYSALRAATILARHHGGKAIFGSATPSVAEFYTAEHANIPIARLSHTARERQPPTISIVDMKRRDNFMRHRFLSNTLLTAMETTLAEGRQVLLFHNRRGSTSLTLCNKCGWMATDPDTNIPLTLHIDTHTLVSHTSSYSEPVPMHCPACNNVDIIHKGVGTKLIETELAKLFPNKKIVRFDGDASQEDSVDQRYGELYDGAIDIIIGTQVIAKGIDLPHLGMVGVVQADTGLALPDYTTDERIFQLLAQAVGRVGRNELTSQVVVQTYQPTHPAIVAGIHQNYPEFYKSSIRTRQASFFPPFTYLAVFSCSYKTEAAAIKNTRLLHRTLRQYAPKNVTFFGPAPSFYEKQHGTYRWHIIAKSPDRKILQTLVTHLPPKNWQFELDPLNLL